MAKGNGKLLLGGAHPFKQIGKPRLVESTNGYQAVRVEGVFQNYNVINENGRRYGKSVWDTNFSEGSEFMNRLNERAVLGHIEHPESGLTSLEEASHVIVEVRYASSNEVASNPDLEEGDIIGAYETLPTPKGKILESLLLAGVHFGVSSRGNGTVSEAGDCVDVNDDFLLETFDAVASPSVVRAIPKVVTESNVCEVIRQIQENLHPQNNSTDSSVMSQPKEDNDKDKPTQAESSFVLATGIMNDGEQLIPIQLIAESDQTCRWYRQGTNKPLPQFKAFPTVDEAIRTLTTFCEDNGREYRLPLAPTQSAPVSGTVTESNDMNTIYEMRKVSADVIRLGQTDVKGLKPSQRMAFFESCRDFRAKINGLVEEDASLKGEAQKSIKIIEDFEEQLDAPEVEPDLGGEDEGGYDAPEEGGDTTDPVMVASTLEQAADMLRQNCAEDPSCGDMADELEAIACELDEEGCGDGEEEFDDEFAPEMGGEEDMPRREESRKRRQKRLKALRESRRKKGQRTEGRWQRQFRLLEARYKKLQETASKLLTKHTKLKEETVGKNAEGTKGLSERAQRFEEAARELAGRYNTDMCEMGCSMFRQNRADLWEQYGPKLLRCKTFEDFTQLSERIVEKHPDPANTTEDLDLGDENDNSDGAADKDSTQTENKDGQEVKGDGKGEAEEGNLGESTEVHPGLAMVKRVRLNESRPSAEITSKKLEG